MSSKSDLALLADSITKLAEELARATSHEDRIEIAALFELTRETYTIVKARLGNAARTVRVHRRSSCATPADLRVG